jgi:hypothetical protein
VLLTLVLAKPRLVGLRLATGAGTAVPEPLRVTVCGELEALSATESVAVKLATDAGVKVMEIVQLAEAARAVPQVLVCAKSVGLAPVIEIAMPVSEALPVFDNVMVEAALVVFTVWFAKPSEAGESEATGAVGEVAVPFKVMVWTVPSIFNALSVSLSVPLILPLVAGVKLMGRVHDVAAASVAVSNEVEVNNGHAVAPVLFRLKLGEMLGFVPVAGIGKVNVAFPMFEKVTVCGLSLLVEPTLVEAKVRLGPAPSAIFSTLPVPESAIYRFSLASTARPCGLTRPVTGIMLCV